jgi:hypothetical protein
MNVNVWDVADDLRALVTRGRPVMPPAWPTPTSSSGRSPDAGAAPRRPQRAVSSPSTNALRNLPWGSKLAQSCWNAAALS